MYSPPSTEYSLWGGECNSVFTNRTVFLLVSVDYKHPGLVAIALSCEHQLCIHHSVTFSVRQMLGGGGLVKSKYCLGDPYNESLTSNFQQESDGTYGACMRIVRKIFQMCMERP